MRRTLALAAVVAALVVPLACSDDNNALKDLPVKQQTIDTGPARVASMPDDFSNVAHKCVNYDGQVIGIWNTTRKVTMLIYDDPACPGHAEKPPFVVPLGIGPVTVQP